MANWQLITETKFTASGAEGMSVKLYYDADRTTVTSTVVRFTGQMYNGWYNNSYASSGFYLLWDPHGDSEKMITIKAHGKNWPTTSAEITITKKYSAASFNIPAYWFCYLGEYGKPNVTNRTLEYNDHGVQSMYWYCNTGSRSGYTTKKSSSTLPGTKAEEGGNPTISFKNNGNNTFTLSGKTGKNGANNKIIGTNLFYTTNGKDPSLPDAQSGRISIDLGTTGTTSEASFSRTISIPADYNQSNASCPIRAAIFCYFEHGTESGPKGAGTSGNVLYYVAPGVPGTPNLSYSKSRLTLKENWTFTWDAAVATNESSPVKGYRIRLLKNGNRIHIYNSSGTKLSSGSDGLADDKYYDRDGTSNSITINPVMHGFAVKDTVQLTVNSYTKNGTGNKLFNNTSSASRDNPLPTVQNAGIVRVKVGNEWKEGQVWVKTSDGWKEAETVNVKTSAGWKESQ